MLVRDAMSPLVVEVGPAHTLRHASRLMAERHVGSAIVTDPDGAGPGILTERDILQAIGRGEDLDTALVGTHVTMSVVYAEPEWSLDAAAAAMIDGEFRHLVVLHGPDVVGVLSVRDIVRSWAGARGLLGSTRRAAGSYVPEPKSVVAETA